MTADELAATREHLLLQEIDRLREREATWARLFVDSFCRPEQFETCGDPFCVEARERRDAYLAGAAR